MQIKTFSDRKYFFCGKFWFMETSWEAVQFGAASSLPPILNVFLGISYKVSNWRKYFGQDNVVLKIIIITVNIFQRNWPMETYQSETIFKRFFFLTVFWISELLRDFGFFRHLSGWREGLLANVWQPRGEGVRWSDWLLSESTHQPLDKEVLRRLFAAGEMK